MAQSRRTYKYPSPNPSLPQVPYAAAHSSVPVKAPPNTSTPQTTQSMVPYPTFRGIYGNPIGHEQAIAPTAISHAPPESQQHRHGVIDLTSNSSWDSYNIPSEAVPDIRFRAHSGLRTAGDPSMLTLGQELFSDLSPLQTPSTSHVQPTSFAPVESSRYAYSQAFQSTPQEQGTSRKRGCVDEAESQPAAQRACTGRKRAQSGLVMSAVGEYVLESSDDGGVLLPDFVAPAEIGPQDESRLRPRPSKRGKNEASEDRILDWPPGLTWLIPGRTMKDGKPKCHENLAGGDQCTRRAYEGSNRCARHTGSWLYSQPGCPMLQYDPLIDFEQARALLYPTRRPLPSATYDRTLERETGREDFWVHEFVTAADSPPLVEAGTDQATRDHIEAQGHNFTGTVALKRFTNPKGSYSLKMINVRMRILFRVALWVHKGGEAIIPLSGDNEGYGATEMNYNFFQRLQTLRSLLRDYKLIAMDVIEGRGLVAVAECPEKVRKRKVQNQTSNKNKEKMIDAERRRQQAMLRGDVPDDAAPHPPRKGKGRAPKAPKVQGMGTQPKKVPRQVKAPVVEMQAPTVELQAPAVELQRPEEPYNTEPPQYLYLDHGAAEPTRYEHVGLYMPQAGPSTQPNNLSAPCNNSEADRTWFGDFSQQLQAYDDTSRAGFAAEPSNANGMGAEWFTDYDAFIQAEADEVASWQQPAGEAGNGEVPNLDMFGAQPANGNACDGNDFDVYGFGGGGVDDNGLYGSGLDSAQFFGEEFFEDEPHLDDADGQIVKQEPLDNEKAVGNGAFDQERVDAVTAEVSSPPSWEDALEYPESKVAAA